MPVAFMERFLIAKLVAQPDGCGFESREGRDAFFSIIINYAFIYGNFKCSKIENNIFALH